MHDLAVNTDKGTFHSLKWLTIMQGVVHPLNEFILSLQEDNPGLMAPFPHSHLLCSDLRFGAEREKSNVKTPCV